LLTAHMDTTPNVNEKKRNPVKNIVVDIQEPQKGNEIHYISSPEGIGGDDRCGVYIILRILAETEIRPSILFCEDEEIGCVGSDKFACSEYCSELENLNFLLECDRRGNNDLVFYNDDNRSFHIWCEKTTGYKENYGSCSDISLLMEVCGISGVNISVGYYDEHTINEYICAEDLELSYEKVKLLVESGMNLDKPFLFKQSTYNYYSDNYWIEDGDGYVIYYKDNNEDFVCETVYGYTKEECVGKFLMDHVNMTFNDIIAIRI